MTISRHAAWAAVILMISTAVSPAAQKTLGGARGINFSCDVKTRSCECDGSFEDCRAMEANCRDGRIPPGGCITETEGDVSRTTCYCDMASRVRVPLDPAIILAPDVKQ
jgi:hypothetical protein